MTTTNSILSQLDEATRAQTENYSLASVRLICFSMFILNFDKPTYKVEES